MSPRTLETWKRINVAVIATFEMYTAMSTWGSKTFLGWLGTDHEGRKPLLLNTDAMTLLLCPLTLNDFGLNFNQAGILHNFPFISRQA